MKGYRHELKYYISHMEYQRLSRICAGILSRDPHAGPTGEYHIRSLYFDDYKDSAMKEKIDGVEKRDKYRIRIYNYSDRVIKLECKHKEGSSVQKTSVSLTREECSRLIDGDYRFLLHHPRASARRMYIAFATLHLKPKVIVDYVREAYLFALEDVRITFDKDIRTALYATDLFDPTLPTYPAQTDYDMVMEVKFNEYLPSHIRTIIQSVAQRSAISKYCLSRRYEG